MALFVPGMACSISGEPILSAADAVMFPPFVSNEADPLHIFSDAVIKADVFRSHPLADQAQSRYEEYIQKTAPAARLCRVCGRPILDPDDYFELGYLVDNPDGELYAYNYSHFHRSCLATWVTLAPLVDRLAELQSSGRWMGYGPSRTLEELRSLIRR